MKPEVCLGPLAAEDVGDVSKEQLSQPLQSRRKRKVGWVQLPPHPRDDLQRQKGLGVQVQHVLAPCKSLCQESGSILPKPKGVCG